MTHKILVVEADETKRTALAALLSGAGHRVVSVADAPTGFTALRTEEPDLLVANIRLDGYNGLQLVAMGPNPIRAIVLTEFPDDTLAVDAKRLGADYIVQPVADETLLARVDAKLQAVGTEEFFVPARQWPRKAVAGGITLELDGLEARIIDVSHGGARLDVALGEPAVLPGTVKLSLPGSETTIAADVMWQRTVTPGRRLCGVAIDPEAEPSWPSYVDALP